MPKKESAWIGAVAAACVGGAVLFYALSLLIFRDPRETFFLILQDLGFLFLNVLLVVVLVERLLARRERRERLEKLNMVIGAFFSEVGLELLRRFRDVSRNADALRPALDIRPGWTARDFKAAAEAARTFPYDVAAGPADLEGLRDVLARKRDFLVRLLENPSLLEHERFTDLLWAVFHLSDEFSFREGGLDALPESDLRHLRGDLVRAGAATAGEWLAYAGHLKTAYPFLFSLAVRIHPFGPGDSAVVRD